MRGLLGRFLLLLTLVTAAQADTTFVAAGAVSGIWEAIDSPFIVQGHINVSAGSSLRIGPGVRVYFTGPYHLAVDSLAEFNALGAQGDSVVFTTDTLQNPQGWSGLQIRRAVDTVSIRFSVVEFVRPFAEDYGSQAEAGCLRIQHSTFRYNQSNALDVINSDLWLSDCVLIHNRGNAAGGGFISGCRAKIERCVFSDNTGAVGALDIVTYGPTRDTVFVSDCLFRDNYTRDIEPWGGGAVQVDLTPAVFRRCTFTDNLSTGAGGAVKQLNSGWLWMDSCLFSGNSALSGGALMANWDFDLTHCVFDHNQAVYGGALALYASPQGNRRLENCTLIGNAATSQGSAIYVHAYAHAAPSILNCILAQSSGSNAVVTYPADSVALDFRYNLCFANTNGDFLTADPNLGSISTVNANGDSCDTYNNLFRDPRLVDPATGECHLQALSPCIDAGSPTAPLDPDNTVADIGAYYFHQTPNGNRLTRASTPPREFSLSAAYPNPFNATTVLAYDVPRAARVTLTLYNLLGEQVATLVDAPTQPGRYHATWNAAAVASGPYLAVLQSGETRLTQKLLLLK